MSEANAPTNEQAPAQKLITELKVSGHLMALEPGLFCIVAKPSPAADPLSGMPGIRLSLPPGIASRPDAVSISTFRPDGWLNGGGDAALVRVVGGPAQILVTIYQSPMAREGAPGLQVLRLMEPASSSAARAQAAAALTRTEPAAEAAPAIAAPTPDKAPVTMEVVAHIQTRGDVGGMIGDWVGIKGSKNWIEGFGLAPLHTLSAGDIEYQAVLGRGWLSPWVEGGQFCGSRGMALPILGLRVRLRGAAAETHDVVYSASFIDRSEVGPVTDGEPCEAESLAALESFRIEIRAKGAAVAAPVAVAVAVAAAADAAASSPAEPEKAKKGAGRKGESRKR